MFWISYRPFKQFDVGYYKVFSLDLQDTTVTHFVGVSTVIQSTRIQTHYLEHGVAKTKAKDAPMNTYYGEAQESLNVP